MDFKKVSLAFVGALAVGALFSACPGDGTGTLYGDCTSDLTCSSGEICHPDAKVCVKTCETADDCGSEAKTCAEVTEGSDQKVCQCSTDALCAGYEAGLSCDLATAVCKGEGGGGTDGGVVGSACTGEGQSTCNYGLFCDSTSKCAQAPLATASCENFEDKGIDWTSSSTGPVIYSIESIAPWTAFCSADSKAFTARVKAYNANGTFPSRREDMSGFFYVTVNGTERDATLLMNDARYRITNQGKNGEFDLTFCAATNLSSVQVGLYFTNGNEVCANVED